MSSKEIRDFNTVIKTYGKKVAESKEESKKMLEEIGVITKKGNVRKQFRNLCTATVQD